MRSVFAALLALIGGLAIAADNIVGFDEAGSDEQRALEARLDTYISADEVDLSLIHI